MGLSELDSNLTILCFDFSSDTSEICFLEILIGIMGRVFLEHIGGTKLYNCAQCDTNLTNKSQLISTR